MKDKKKTPETKKPEAPANPGRRKSWPDHDLADYKRDKPARPEDLERLNER